MSYYIGTQAADPQGDARYFYAIRRDEAGMLYFSKVDQLKDDDSITINEAGLVENDFTQFEYNVDYFEGRTADDHSRPYPNLAWDQYRWDSRNIFYYINDNGDFVVRINKGYVYPPDQIV